MRASCPKCGAVFEIEFRPLLHVGRWKYIKCPACGKSSIRLFVTPEVSWPLEEHGQKDRPLTDEELKRRRTEDSKSEEPDRDRKDPGESNIG